MSAVYPEPQRYTQGSVRKECLAIPQEEGGLPEMVVSQNTAGLIRSLCRRGSGGSAETRLSTVS
jgi:hypothetical protein